MRYSLSTGYGKGGEKSLPLSDVDKIQVINKIEGADSESGLGLHESYKSISSKQS